jgi:proprotein convertase subtilisin/kexin type 5
VKFDYLVFKFKIWDHFSRFTLDSNIITFRASVYNPEYYMPSLANVIFNFNFPPTSCSLLLDPPAGIPLLTNFSISVVGCFDEDLPLSYRYGYY